MASTLFIGGVYGQQPKNMGTANRVAMKECEDTCGTWKFLLPSATAAKQLQIDVIQGIGRWPNGDIAHLIIKLRAIQSSSTINRTDLSGSHEGMFVQYTGTSDADGLHGKFVAQWPDHWDKPHTGDWHATPAKASPDPPSEMHWCSAHCGTLHLDSGPPFDTPHYGSIYDNTTITVESFTKESVIMHRTDRGQVPGKATLTGQLSDDEQHIVNWKIEWTDHPCCGYAKNNYWAAWGTSINEVPGSDAELQARGGSPVQSSGNGGFTVHDLTEGIDLFTSLVKAYYALHPNQ